MSKLFEDQAEGLRRLFSSAPPEVLTVVPCGSAAILWVARQLALRVRAGLRVLALDESMASGNLADCLGVSPRFDLLQAAEGYVAADRCLVEVTTGMHLAPVARLARAMGTDRVVNQHVLAQFQRLQPDFDEWVVLAKPAGVGELSLLALAAPRVLLAVDPHAISITEAYSTLKKLVSGADTLSVGLALANKVDRDGLAMVENLRAVARKQLGVSVDLVGSIGESLALEADAMRNGNERCFIDRLRIQAQLAAQPRVMRRMAV